MTSFIELYSLFNFNMLLCCLFINYPNCLSKEEVHIEEVHIEEVHTTELMLDHMGVETEPKKEE